MHFSVQKACHFGNIKRQAKHNSLAQHESYRLVQVLMFTSISLEQTAPNGVKNHLSPAVTHKACTGLPGA